LIRDLGVLVGLFVRVRVFISIGVVVRLSSVSTGCPVRGAVLRASDYSLTISGSGVAVATCIFIFVSQCCIIPSIYLILGCRNVVSQIHKI
jgi:hypothetical protein